jgi:hypothetical protein
MAGRWKGEGRDRWGTEFEDCDVLALFGSDFADDFAKALDNKYRGSDVPQIDQIKDLLTDAVHLCRQRNFLAHGTWWCFNRRASIVDVRGGVRWEPELPPESRKYTVSDIEAIAGKFKHIEAELYKIRRSFEPQMTEAETRGAFSFLHSSAVRPSK